MKKILAFPSKPIQAHYRKVRKYKRRRREEGRKKEKEKGRKEETSLVLPLGDTHVSILMFG